MTDSMKLHNPFLISIDTYYNKTRIYYSRFFISRRKNSEIYSQVFRRC